MNMAVDLRTEQYLSYLTAYEAKLQETSRTEEEASAGEEEEKETADQEEEEKNDPSGEIIRVLLMTSDYESYFHPSVSLVCDGKEVICSQETMEIGDDPLLLSAGESGIEVSSLQRQDGHPVYEGTLEIRRREEGFLLINELPLETYLEAVVPSEMPSGYEKEALKAQAVCARTYAWKQMQDNSLEEYGADVDDSVNYQVYRNIPPQQTTTEAVRETRGQILCQNGEPVEAYYFSTSAGATSTDEIWGAEEPSSYLKSVSCTFDENEPWSWWQVEIPWTELSGRAETYIGKPGELLGITVTEKTESGAVTGLQVVTEAGTLQLGEEYEIREFLSPRGCMITEKNGTQTEGGTLLPSSYFSAEAVHGDSILITGSGYGHGVGMSQNAANVMAAQGYSCQEILDYFFNNVQIQEIY